MASRWWSVLILLGVVVAWGCNSKTPSGAESADDAATAEDLTPPKVNLDDQSPADTSEKSSATQRPDAAASSVGQVASGPTASPSAAVPGGASDSSAAASTATTPAPTDRGATAAGSAVTDSSQLSDAEWGAHLQEVIDKNQLDEAIKWVAPVVTATDVSPQRTTTAMMIFSGVAEVEEAQEKTENLDEYRKNALILARRILSTRQPVPEQFRFLAMREALTHVEKLAADLEPAEVKEVVELTIDGGWEDFRRFDQPNLARWIGQDSALKAKIDAARAKVRDRRIADIEREMEGFKPYEFAFDLPRVDGGSMSLESLRGKVVMANIWGTWCEVCLVEIPLFVSLQEQYGKQGLQIVGLTFENEEGDAAVKLVTDYIKANGINYPCLMGTPEYRKQLPDSLAFPSTLFIDRTGKVRLVLEGLDPQFHDVRVETAVKKLLAEPAPAHLN